MESETIADLLASAQVLAGRDFETEFTYRRGDDAADEAERAKVTVIRHVAVGDRVLVERTDFERAGDDDASRVQYRSRDIWDGRTCLTTHPAEPENVSLSGHVSSGDLFGHGFMFNLVDGRFGPARVASHLRGTRPLECTVAEDTLTYRFAQPGTPARFAVMLRLEPRVQMLGFSLELDRADGGGILSRDYRVHAWQTFGDLEIPGTASLTIQTRARRGPRGASRIDYERLSWRAIPAAETGHPRFAHLLAPGTGVYDERLGVGYRIGDTHLHVDGVGYELATPIAKPVDELDDLLARATRIERPSPERVRDVMRSSRTSVADGAWRGSRHRSFGAVDAQPCCPREHTFELANQAGRDVTVLGVRPSCGCHATADRDVIPPGETIRITAKLDVSGTGLQLGVVVLLTDHPDEPEVHLTLDAIGRRWQPLRVWPTMLHVTAEGEAELHVIAEEHTTDDAPPPPHVVADGTGLCTRFAGWRQLHPRDEAWALPARWEGRIAVTVSGGSARLPVGATAGAPPCLTVAATPEAPLVHVFLTCHDDAGVESS